MNDLLWWLLQPSGVAVLVLLLVWLLLVAGATGAGRRLLALLLLAVVAWVFLPAESWLAAPLEARHPFPEALPEEVDGVVVLGGSVDGAVSRARGQLNLNAAGERMVAAAALAQRYPQARLVLTGVEPTSLARDLVADPSPASLLFGPAFDGRDVRFVSSRSTYEDALATVDAVQRGPGETWLLVTSAWHMPRAMATFTTLGWTPDPYPVDYLSGGGGPRLAIGSFGERLAVLDRVGREWGALIVYRATGRIDADLWP